MPTSPAEFALTLLLLSGSGAAAAERAGNTSTLQVEFDGFRSSEGEALCALFDEKGWRSQNPRLGHSVPITEGRALCSFEQLPEGRYAVAVYHDENRNEKLDTGVMGIPSEGFAFSRAPRLILGLPRFTKTALRLAEGQVREVERTIRYLLP